MILYIHAGGDFLNTRIKEIRKAVNLTQDEFGKRLGISNTAISKIEKGENNVSEQNIISICREFNVNEKWLRNGTGEIFMPRTRNQVITDFLGDLIKENDTFKKRFIESLAKLEEHEWDVLKKVLEGMTNKRS